MTGVRLATSGDRTRVLDTLVTAFAADPVLRYLFPGDAEYRSGAAMFFGALFDKRVAAGTAWVAEDGRAVAMWDDPDATGSSDLSGLDAAVLTRVAEYDDAVHAALPSTPFWYLGVLGTHPDVAGRGWGRALMSAGIAAAGDVPCVLETSNPANVGFYGRSGWQVIGAIDHPVPTWILRVNPVPPLARR
jgi:GNAT superfamily N-acetyltransferase